MLGESTRGEQRVREWRHAVAIAASRLRADIAFAAVDVAVVVGAYVMGMGFRMLDPLIGDPLEFWSHLAQVLPLFILIHLFANVVFGAYGHVWEHASLGEARQVVAANLLAGVTALIAVDALRRWDIVVPYSVVVIGGLLSLAGMGLVRFRSRMFSFHKSTAQTSRILVVGNGRAAASFAREAPALPEGGVVIGFVSDDGIAGGSVRRLAGLPILGTLDALEELVHAYDVDQVVVAGGGAARVRQVVDRCLAVDVRLRILPGTEDVMRGEQVGLDVRDIRLEDLLVRSPVSTDLAGVASILRGKRVLITGAGGSIGSEIVRQVVGFAPAEVWALDRDESLLHEAALRWRAPVNQVLCDVRDRRAVMRLTAEVRPEVVFHAAALKHVPVLERFPEEAVATNVVGTLNVIEAGSLHGMERFVLISTDKAVDPSSVMGATKRMAEMLTQIGAERADGCVYSAVRFGNVLGSRGSVVPTFIEQIKSGGPVTVTDPDMTRYFMTVDEAVQLVLQAAALARGSEVFVLDMGEPVRIVDLARRLIRLAGLAPERDIPIWFTGRRPGEKLTERLAHQDELFPTDHPSVFQTTPPTVTAAATMDLVLRLRVAAEEMDREAVRQILNECASGRLAAQAEIDIRDRATVTAWS